YLRRPGSTAEPGVTQQNCRAVERIHVICESGLNPVDGYFNGLLGAKFDIYDNVLYRIYTGRKEAIQVAAMLRSHLLPRVCLSP
ncbi:hypothetical protein, partial [Burkholderia anthina]|uniref:hypothetical protein n=1 Tax=Burkholderia anthina TaxID=179879 RepID=UPI001ABACE2E